MIFPPAAIGFTSCLAMMFLIDAIYSAVAIGNATTIITINGTLLIFSFPSASSLPHPSLPHPSLPFSSILIPPSPTLPFPKALLLIIIIYLLIRGPAKPWGEVSQAIIYHQVGSSHPSFVCLHGNYPPFAGSQVPPQTGH